MGGWADRHSSLLLVIAAGSAAGTMLRVHSEHMFRKAASATPDFSGCGAGEILYASSDWLIGRVVNVEAAPASPVPHGICDVPLSASPAPLVTAADTPDRPLVDASVSPDVIVPGALAGRGAAAVSVPAGARPSGRAAAAGGACKRHNGARYGVSGAWRSFSPRTRVASPSVSAIEPAYMKPCRL